MMITPRKSIIAFLFILFLAVNLSFSNPVLAHWPIVVTESPQIISDTNKSQAFFGSINGEPQAFDIISDKDFKLYLNILVPATSNPTGRYSVTVTRDIDRLHPVMVLNESDTNWLPFHEKFANDHYLKGPESQKNLPAGNYRILVYSNDNFGKYVLAVGQEEIFPIQDSIKLISIVRKLKINFFQTSPTSLLFSIIGSTYLSATLLLSLVISFFVCRNKKIKSLKVSKDNILLFSIFGFTLLGLSLYFWNPIIIFMTVFTFYFLVSKILMCL